MIRRFGIAHHNGNMDIICNLCGLTVGEHLGQRGEICPIGGEE